MLDDTENNRLDQSLRDRFSEYDLPPSGQVWSGIEQRLATLPPVVLPRRRRYVPVPLLLALVALLSGLGGWLLPRGTEPPARGQTGAQPAQAPANAAQLTMEDNNGASQLARLHEKSGAATKLSAASGANAPVMQNRERVKQVKLQAAANSKQLASPSITTTATPSAAPEALAAALNETPPAATPAAPSETLTASATRFTATDTAGTPVLPAAVRQLVALERRRLQLSRALVVSTEGSEKAQLDVWRAQRDELARLLVRTDSALVALGEMPKPATVAALADSAQLPAPRRRWSVLLAVTPEQNALTLQGRESDTLTALRRNHETGRTGLNAALTAEYQLNQRVSVGGGLGYSTYGAELRLTNKRTDVQVTYDTTTTRTSSSFTRTSRVFSVRIVQVPTLNPVFNGNGQVLRYDTVYVARQDTIFSTITTRDSTKSTQRVITPLISKREVTTYKALRPNYHFLTLPVVFRYRITPYSANARLWADLTAGAQLQFFLGGTQAVTEDGVNYRTESIGVGAGPFRPLNLALSGNLALNYALSSRLSVSVAPSLRWQALSVYKAETGLRQQPTATGLQLGMRWRL